MADENQLRQPLPNVSDDAFSEPAPAKLNLYLHITDQRDDGYHLVDSLVSFAGLGDRLNLAEADPRGTGDIQLEITGPYGRALDAASSAGDNLVFRAARALADLVAPETRLKLVLDKHLPLAGGIGGGSADAAATLRLLCRHWELDTADARIQSLLLPLGADLPVCLSSRPAIVRGIGEQLGPVAPFPELPVVLVNPGIAQPTPAVFRARKGKFDKPVKFPAEGFKTVKALAEWLDQKTVNGLYQSALGLTPVLGRVMTALAAQKGCRLARMSGSGNTCFGLFGKPADAAAAAAAIASTEPGWWVCDTVLAGAAGDG